MHAPKDAQVGLLYTDLVGDPYARTILKMKGRVSLRNESPTMKRTVYWGAVMGMSLLIAACGSGTGGDETTATTGAETTTTEGTTTTTVIGVTGARPSVVQIIAEGTFIDPVEGELSGAGAGSGFVMAESGLVVTNNHVVTGAALLRVYVDGEDEPRNAKIIGVSECSDLAVIDIEGDGFPFLEWRTAPAQAGLAIFALGFPLGDPEYTVLDGVISKETADGETWWASVDSVIEHTADILPGNSGGPVVDEQGRVVGISYALTGERQPHAISGELASSVVDQLARGETLDSIGINGQAFVSDDGEVSGVWVASVSSGSPADLVGILPGDILTRMEGLTLARDGTMSDYCDILRTHDADAALKVEVVRIETGELLQGTINQDRLEAVEQDAPNPDSGDASAGYDNYDTLADDSGTLSVNVPTVWSDRLATTWEREGGAIGPGLSAAPNRDDFLSGWAVPGVFLGASRILFQEYGSAESYLDTLPRYDETCDSVTRGDYDDGFYFGVYDLYEGCTSTDADLLVLAALPSNTQNHIVYLNAQALTDADWEAILEALDTFTSTGEF